MDPRLWIADLYDMNSFSQMQGGQNWILPKEIKADAKQGGKTWILLKDMKANQLFWDSNWLEIWKNHLCPSMGPNGGSVATDSDWFFWDSHWLEICRNR